jgi:predicted secreted hydrolase
MTRPPHHALGPVPTMLSTLPFTPNLSKRAFTQLGLAAGAAALLPKAHALPERTLAFPRDHGAHPDFRTEWWYITGHAKTPAGQNSAGREFGFQVTFFRSRVEATQNMQSQFAAKQLIFAHCAVTDVQGKKLWHDQRIAREGFGIALAAEADTDVKLRNWTLQRVIPKLKSNLAALDAEVAYEARIAAKDFALDLRFTETQALLLQGNQGLSRKGPDEKQASYYYSKPHLAARGSITLQGQSFDIQGTAWLDHEWSQELLHPEAVGWDWIGMNLFDGSALTAFQLRRKDGSALWTGGSFRSAWNKLASAAPQYTFIAKPGEVKFQALKPWTSPTTGATYPTEWLVRTPADYYTVRAVIPNQELDSRNSTGAVYWEGLSDLFDSNDKHVGRGYLEMTGYAGALRM